MNLPCRCRRQTCPGAVVGEYTPDQCFLRWLALNSREYGPKWGGAMPANPLPIPRRKPRRPTCQFLGPVREAATCCGTSNVYACLHDDAPWDLCTLGPNARPGEVGDCSTCPLRQVAVAE